MTNEERQAALDALELLFAGDYGEEYYKIRDAILRPVIFYAGVPKYKKVDLDGMRLINDGFGFELQYNRAIDDIKAKYGEIYAEVKE